MIPAAGLELQGRYQLVERIALGGMGEVWRATDLRSGRAVAAKILRPELAGDEIFLSRLRAEARNSRGLRHPNLAVVLDSGERDGSGWIIMELVQGEALSDVLERQGTMSPAEILPILAQVARALQVVHDAGVVHRDVKPSNILINREGLAKLTDFGISTGAHQRPLTATGMVMGTAQYLAPEQAVGNMATPSGDLYALGVIAYEALVGHRPFTGATQVDIAFAHVNEPVPPLPDEIHPEVREVVMELLAKEPAARPRSARELARRLDRIIIHLPQESWDPRQAPVWVSTRSVAPAASGRVGPAASGVPASGAGPTTSQPASSASRRRPWPGWVARSAETVRPGRLVPPAARGRAAAGPAGPGGARTPAPAQAAGPTRAGALADPTRGVAPGRVRRGTASDRKDSTRAIPAARRERAAAADSRRVPTGPAVREPRHSSGLTWLGMSVTAWTVAVCAVVILLLTIVATLLLTDVLGTLDPAPSPSASGAHPALPLLKEFL